MLDDAWVQEAWTRAAQRKLEQTMLVFDGDLPPLRRRYDATVVEVDNGDCLFDVLARLLCRLADAPAPSTPEATAASMRRVVHAFLDERWTRVAAVSGMRWGEAVTLAHNVAVTVDERDEYGSWGVDLETCRQAWLAERDSHFGGELELGVFVEMAKERGVPLTLRLWRGRGNRSPVATLTTDAGRPTIVADLVHVGGVDTASAHWRFAQSASFTSM